MRIRLTGLTDEPQTFDYQTSASNYLKDEDTFPGDIQIKAIVHKEMVLLRLMLSVRLSCRFYCDRCGQAFLQQQDSKDVFFFAFADGKTFPTEDNEEDSNSLDIPIIPKNTVDIDISREIRDLILLDLPYQKLCRSDCKGVCQNCGADLNTEECRCRDAAVDPRWEALQKLRENNS